MKMLNTRTSNNISTDKQYTLLCRQGMRTKFSARLTDLNFISLFLHIVVYRLLLEPEKSPDILKKQ